MILLVNEEHISILDKKGILKFNLSPFIRIKRRHYMLFSEKFNFKFENEDFFDPILHKDTKLFIDPFLIFKSKHPFFQNTYTDMMKFINTTFELVAKSTRKKGNLNYNKALSMLRFHEVNEICLGYSSDRTGSGPGPKWSETLAKNIAQCIDSNILKLKHIEEIGLFSEGIGPDSISDITANLIKKQLVVYTQHICHRYNIPMTEVTLNNAEFDWEYLRWESKKVLLPINSFKERHTGILLIPKIFLREIPEINSEDFHANLLINKDIRNDLNFEIDKNLNKKEITKLARENYEIVEEYLKTKELLQSTPYNLDKDPKFRYQWYHQSKIIAESHPINLQPPKNDNSFFKIVYEISDTFKNFIENNSGYKLLWDENGKQGKSEEAVQLLFHGIVNNYCIANNIDLTREVNQGRGPVDFRFSTGYQKRILLEIKLIRNTKFWHGLEKQLPKYLEIDNCKEGIFLITAYTKKDLDKVNEITSRVNEVNRIKDLNIKIIKIDATYSKPSASNI